MPRRRRRRGGSRSRRLIAQLRANPAPWLLFVVAAAWLVWFVSGVHVYFVMPDELRYVRQAVSWGSGRPVVPGSEAWVTWSQLQPILMAPLWAALPTEQAYHASQILMALAFASSVFPGYLLARDVLGSHGWAMAAAASIVVVPWSVMSGVLMLENVAYPLFLWAMLAVHRAGVARTPRAGLVAAAALLAAFFARTQFLVLWPVLPLVLVAQELRFPTAAGTSIAGRLRAVASTHRVLLALAVLVVAAYLANSDIFLGDAPRGRPHLNLDSLSYAGEYLAYVAVGVGVVPLALFAAWALPTLTRPADRAAHAFAVLALSSVAILVLVVGAGSRDFLIGSPLEAVNDRYVMYAAPLLVVGMLAFLTRSGARGALLILVGGVLAAGVVWSAQLALIGQTFVSPTAAFHIQIQALGENIGRRLGVGWTTRAHTAAALGLLVCCLVALGWRVLPRRSVSVAVALLVGAYCLAETTYTRARLTEIQPAASYAHGRDWVDRRLGPGRAVVLVSQLSADTQSVQASWWDLSFWNKRIVADRYAFDPKVTWDGQAVSRAIHVDTRYGAVRGLGGFRYMVRGVADRRFGFLGEHRFGDPWNDFQIWLLPSQARLRWWFRGLESGLVLPGHPAAIRLFGDGHAGRRPIRVFVGTPVGHPGGASFTLRGVGTPAYGRTRRPGQAVALRGTLFLPARGHADLTLTAGREGAQFFEVQIG